MLGGKNKQQLGYTIIELMIVLAVSGFMFVIAANFINGKQERSSFTSGVNETASEIQDVVEQVTDGKYSDIPVPCTYNGGVIGFNGSPSSQGSDSSCVFLGKIIRMPAKNSTNTYSVLSVVGGRLGSGDSNLGIGPNAGDPSVADLLTTQQTIPQSLDVSSVTAHDSANNYTTETFGFIQSQGQADAINDNASFSSGGQVIDLVYSPGIIANNTDSSVNNNLDLATSIDICLTDGVQQAKISVGTNNSQLNVNVVRLSSGASCS